jgi:glucan phosphoethanolaminetransferase (alkaline phosphatase superfamily)
MKKLFRWIILLIFLGAALFSIVLIIKPGAAIFHIKQTVNTGEVKTDEGYLYRYPIKFNALIFPPESVLLYEDGLSLERTFTAEVVDEGMGRYSLIDQGNGLFYLNFSASDNSNPLTNGKKYTLYFQVSLLSRATGINLLGILTLGLAWFLLFALKSPARRQALVTSPLTIWQVFDAFLDQEVSRLITPITNPQSLSQSRRVLWIYLLLLTAAAAYFYVFMEWLFFVTKPSFMDLVGWLEKFGFLFLPSMALAIFSLAIVLILAGLDYLLSLLRPSYLLIFLGTLIPSFILTAISLLLVDNFTYTIFKIGIVSSAGIWRYAYGLGFITLFIFINIRILEAMGLRGEPKPLLKIPRFIFALMAGLLMISATFLLTQYIAGYSENARAANQAGESTQAAKRPNILIIGSDGLNATNMSLYGYERETTPVLEELANSSLLAENAFANSSNSGGSITSMLTGKPPAQTRVLYPPNILQGGDAYQHLPGILRKEGYHTVEIGVPHYVDAYQVNLLDGFNLVNERSHEEGEVLQFTRELGFGESAYFASRLVERITDRLLHIFFIRKMENPYTIVTQPVGVNYDRERLSQLLDLIQDTDRPLFVHVHFMGTHGPNFHPERQIFSSGKSQDEGWMVDFYDDSILSFDGYVSEVLDMLKQTAKFTNTILIIYSDHPMQYDVRWRVPLLIHFPNGEHSGRIETNVQNLDIPPTVLDYLSINKPNWMAGQSLLRGDPSATRLIFSSGTSLSTRIGQGRLIIDSTRVKPPFYQFTFFNVVDCHRWYRLDLSSLTWSSGDVPSHTMPCSQDSLLTMGQVKQALADYLLTNGFDISTLP